MENTLSFKLCQIFTKILPNFKTPFTIDTPPNGYGGTEKHMNLILSMLTFPLILI